MTLEMIDKNIRRLLDWVRVADEPTKKRIAVQLSNLYQFEYEILKENGDV